MKEVHKVLIAIALMALIALGFSVPVLAKDGPPPYLHIEMQEGEAFTRIITDRCWQVAAVVAKGDEREADFRRCVEMSGKATIIDTSSVEGVAALNRREAERLKIEFPHEGK